MPRKKKKQCTNPNLSFQSNAPPLLSHPHPPKIYFWQVTAQVKGKLNLLIRTSIALDDSKVLQQFMKL